VTVVGGAVCLVSIVLLYLLMGVLWRVGRPRRRPAGDAGTAAIEFVLVFPVAMVIVMVMIQSMLLVTQNILVHYSAYIAARAAVVWVPEKVSYVETRNVVADADSSGKIDHIRKAAVWALTPAGAAKAGAGGAVGGDDTAAQEAAYRRLFSLYGRQPPNWITRMYPNMHDYAHDYTDVMLRPPAADGVYGDHEALTVTVRHTMFLSVPYVNRLFADKDLPEGDYGTEVEASYTLTNQGVEDDIDVEVFPRYVGRDEE